MKILPISPRSCPPRYGDRSLVQDLSFCCCVLLLQLLVLL